VPLISFSRKSDVTGATHKHQQESPILARLIVLYIRVRVRRTSTNEPLDVVSRNRQNRKQNKQPLAAASLPPAVVPNAAMAPQHELYENGDDCEVAVAALPDDDHDTAMMENIEEFHASKPPSLQDLHLQPRPTAVPAFARHRDDDEDDEEKEEIDVNQEQYEEQNECNNNSIYLGSAPAGPRSDHYLTADERFARRLALEEESKLSGLLDADERLARSLQEDHCLPRAVAADMERQTSEDERLAQQLAAQEIEEAHLRAMKRAAAYGPATVSTVSSLPTPRTVEADAVQATAVTWSEGELYASEATAAVASSLHLSNPLQPLVENEEPLALAATSAVAHAEHDVVATDWSQQATVVSVVDDFVLHPDDDEFDENDVVVQAAYEGDAMEAVPAAAAAVVEHDSFMYPEEARSESILESAAPLRMAELHHSAPSLSSRPDTVGEAQVIMPTVGSSTPQTTPTPDRKRASIVSPLMEPGLQEDAPLVESGPDYVIAEQEAEILYIQDQYHPAEFDASTQAELVGTDYACYSVQATVSTPDYEAAATPVTHTQASSDLGAEHDLIIASEAMATAVVSSPVLEVDHAGHVVVDEVQATEVHATLVEQSFPPDHAVAMEATPTAMVVDNPIVDENDWERRATPEKPAELAAMPTVPDPPVNAEEGPDYLRTPPPRQSFGSDDVETSGRVTSAVSNHSRNSGAPSEGSNASQRMVRELVAMYFSGSGSNMSYGSLVVRPWTCNR
jgi:hypothetical protein